MESVCPKCGSKLEPFSSSQPDSSIHYKTKHPKEPLIAAFLSLLFPGLGQMYNREFKSGATLIVLGAIFAGMALMGTAISMVGSFPVALPLWSILGYVGVLGYGIRDAYYSRRGSEIFPDWLPGK